MQSAIKFMLPAELSAGAPPESRGLSRDGVRLLHICRHTGAVEHSTFRQLGQFLQRGDLLVFNRSRTLPAAISGQDDRSGAHVEVRLAERLPDDTWRCLVFCQGAEDLFGCGLGEGMRIVFGRTLFPSPAGSDSMPLYPVLSADLLERDSSIPRLWRLRFNTDHRRLLAYLYQHGRAIRYEHVGKPWSIEYYQNVYAGEPGSAEMPSAGRAFTWRLLFDLQRRGIKQTSIVLHTGLSSYMDDDLDALHPASEEEYIIDRPAADAINGCLRAAGRVIAVGTTVVRALESAAGEHGFVQPSHSYTRLRITGEHQLRCVHGLITGLHEPEASHLDLLSAFVSPHRLSAAYRAAVEQHYLWHEFGDINLIP